MTSVDRHSQRGAATLVITVLLLFCMSLMMAYSARVGVIEQRLAANDVQARTAFAAAQAGLDRLLAGLAALDRSNIDYDPDGWATVDTLTDVLTDNAGYSTAAHNRGLTPFQANLLRVESEGSSGNGGNTRSLKLVAAFTSLLPNIPPTPLVVRGNLTAAGDLLLSSPDRSAAAWIGGLYTPGGSALDTQLSEPAACPPYGICDTDVRIGTLMPEAFFENTFGRPPEALRSAAHVVQCELCDPAAVPAEHDVIWLENVSTAVTPAAGQWGTAEHPVVVVIDGDFEPAGPLHIYGLLFVLGNWLTGDGTLVADGAVIVAGDGIDIGAAQLAYDADIMTTLHEAGHYSAVPGSWTDF